MTVTGLYNLYILEAVADDAPSISLVTHEVCQGEAAALRHGLTYACNRLIDMSPTGFDPDILELSLDELIDRETREALCEAHRDNAEALHHYLLALPIDKQHQAIKAIFNFLDGDDMVAQCVITPLEIKPDIVVS